MENNTTAERQRKYKLRNQERGVKRIGVVVPVVEIKKIKAIAKKMRQEFKNKGNQHENN